jgi:hypothetical protein
VTGLRTTGLPGVYVEEQEDGLYVVLRNQVQARHECGTTYALVEVAAFPTEEAAGAGARDALAERETCPLC